MGRRTIGQRYLVGGDRDEKSKGYYRQEGESSVAGCWMKGKGTGSGSNWGAAHSSGRKIGQERYDARHQDDQRWIRRR